MTTPLLKTTELVQGQNEAYPTANDALRRLEAALIRVLSRSTTAEPASPADGDTYIIPTGATGTTWSTFTAGQIAYYSGGAWQAFTPPAGLSLPVVDEVGARVRYDTTNGWVSEFCQQLGDRVQTFTASGSFVVPAGITKLVVSGCAGGGGGSGTQLDTSNNPVQGGGGGGAGQVTIRQVITVTPGDTLTITIGSGGAPSGPAQGGVAGGNGTSTSVVNSSSTTLISLAGGAGGAANGGGGAGYPSGGNCVFGLQNIGGTGASCALGGGGGSAGNGSPAGGYGAGGGGANGNALFTGGEGAPGVLFFEW